MKEMSLYQDVIIRKIFNIIKILLEVHELLFSIHE